MPSNTNSLHTYFKGTRQTLRTGILLCLLFAATVVQAQDLTPVTGINDGPYAVYQSPAQADKSGLDVSWICNDKLQKQSYASAASISLPAPCGYPQALTIRPAETAFPATIKFKADKVAAISDIHGQFDLMLKLLQGNGIINQDWQWTFGTGHLVIAGDVLDRGPKVTETLWLLYALEAQAKAAGGAVHLLLGNHETIVMAGDVRYLNKKYAAVAQHLNTSYQQMFDTSSVLGRWLRSKPVIIQVNDMLFMHGGLHPDYQNLNMSLQQVNEKYRQTLGLSKAQIKTDDVLNWLYGSIGPIWYRGYFTAPQLPGDDLNKVLQQLKVDRIVVGHTTMNGVYSHYQGKVISIDSGIKGGVKGEMLFWDKGQLSKAGADGQKVTVPDAPEKRKDAGD
ncbi:metallophosphoesterase [Undibacterium umbellatum]|uniref:Metallophosphoesterase n=1 Tax=Undibacterium umbellatum TaxID=2762300 RepID=A0ABR6ZG27_9BURK|nr:metallophosphoesterase [Undibacterium umbellatum]MBC3910633.1 metallophosphoesterase [Undibacterium umbellatum]